MTQIVLRPSGKLKCIAFGVSAKFPACSFRMDLFYPTVKFLERLGLGTAKFPGRFQIIQLYAVLYTSHYSRQQQHGTSEMATQSNYYPHDTLFQFVTPRSLVVRVSARGPGGGGGARLDPRPRHAKDLKTGRFALLGWRLPLMNQTTDWPAQSQYDGMNDSVLLTSGGKFSRWLCSLHLKTAGWRSSGPNKTGPN